MEPKKINQQHTDAEKRANNQHIAEAHDQAEKDIERDPDLSIHSANDDLDEGELARLGEDDNGVI